MYGDSRLGGSQFRRPWSPEPSNLGHHINAEQDPYPDHPHAHREGSVEALDLADYARTLADRTQGPYPPFPEYPPSPPSRRPLSSPHLQATPSLTSRDTLSSSHHSSPSRNRPFSSSPSHRHSNLGLHHTNLLPQARSEPWIETHDPEIASSHLPPWSRNSYAKVNGTTRSSYPDLDSQWPISQWHSTNKESPFDPAYIPNQSDPFTVDPRGYLSASSLAKESTREFFPWSDDPSHLNGPLHPSVKEERIRMLEREFGQNAYRHPNHVQGGDFTDENGKPLIGTVDSNGNLVTVGPKKRTATRVFQILLALAASIPSIYAAIVIKLKDPPPPANRPPAFVLYVLSVITLFLLLYLFVFRPCCCARKRRPSPISNGMMVLPVQALPGGKAGGKKKVGQVGKGGKVILPPNDIQVNLIVDPDALKGREEEEEDDDDDTGWDGSLPSTRRKKKPRRRSVFAGLAMEEDWKRARKWAQKLAVFDAVSMVLWGATFVYILIGKRCPSGGFDGWCNAYNVSSAAACLLCFAFGLSVFFDVKDLHSSKTSPRTRS